VDGEVEGEAEGCVDGLTVGDDVGDVDGEVEGEADCCVTGNCEDADDDGDLSPDYSDNEDGNEFICSDDDGDGCDDCSLGTFDILNDGEDEDGNGVCDSNPDFIEYAYNQSSYQAFYYVNDIEDMYGEPLTSADWILAFTNNGETCVGMRQWNADGMNDIPVMGDDGQFINGERYSEGYLEIGEEPMFKVYDESEREYFNLHVSDHHGFGIYEIFSMDNMRISMDYEIPLHYYFNLISFYGLPEDDGE
jgi:hypothetical protein